MEKRCSNVLAIGALTAVCARNGGARLARRGAEREVAVLSRRSTQAPAHTTSCASAPDTRSCDSYARTANDRNDTDTYHECLAEAVCSLVSDASRVLKTRAPTQYVAQAMAVTIFPSFHPNHNDPLQPTTTHHDPSRPIMTHYHSQTCSLTALTPICDRSFLVILNLCLSRLLSESCVERFSSSVPRWSLPPCGTLRSDAQSWVRARSSC